MLLAVRCALLASLFAGAVESAAAPKLPADLLAVPLVNQATSYSCGAAALLSVLYYWQVYDGHESGLYAELETEPALGTEPPKIVEAARRRGLKADLEVGLSTADLRAALDRGRTVILDVQAWKDEASTVSWRDDWDDGHYVVLAGMDLENAYVMDPSSAGSYAYLPLGELVERWHDFEDRHGFVQRYLRMGIVVEGKSHLAGSPPAPVLMR